MEERAKSQFFEKVHEEVILKTQEAAKEKEFQSVQAGPAGADEVWRGTDRFLYCDHLTRVYGNRSHFVSFLHRFATFAKSSLNSIGTRRRRSGI